MKKIMVIAALFICTLTAVSVRAEYVSANNLSIYRLKEMISSEYGCQIDEDGDLMINGKRKIYIKLLPKVKMINFSSRFSPYEERTIAEAIRLANKYNCTKRLMRVSIEDDGTSVCDYYMVYDGGLDSTNFKETVSWFDGLVESWVDMMLVK